MLMRAGSHDDVVCRAGKSLIHWPPEQARVFTCAIAECIRCDLSLAGRRSCGVFNKKCFGLRLAGFGRSLMLLKYRDYTW